MKTIKIGGKKRPLDFDYNALCDYEDLVGSNFFDAIRSIDLRRGRALVYMGLKSGARKDNQNFDYTLEEVGEWLQEEDATIMEEVMIIVTESLPQKKKTQDGETEAKKKS